MSQGNFSVQTRIIRKSRNKRFLVKEPWPIISNHCLRSSLLSFENISDEQHVSWPNCYILLILKTQCFLQMIPNENEVIVVQAILSFFHHFTHLESIHKPLHRDKTRPANIVGNNVEITTIIQESSSSKLVPASLASIVPSLFSLAPNSFLDHQICARALVEKLRR